MTFDSIWVIIIFIIVIILLLFKLFDVKIEFYKEINDISASSENTEKREVEQDMFQVRGDGTIKGSSPMLKEKVEIDHKQTSEDYSNTKQIEKKRDETKSELGEKSTIIPEKVIDIKLNTNKKEDKDKVYERVNDNSYKLVEIVNNIDKRTKEDEEIDNEIKGRFKNQEKEYKKAFKCKNELDYEGNVITDENIYQFGDFSYINAHQLFIPTDYKTSKEDYGRNYIPPELWYKNNQRLNLPVCVPANGRCTVKQTMTSGYPLDVIEWHESRKITNPDGINPEYLNEKLNTTSDNANTEMMDNIKEAVREVLNENKN